MVDRSIDGSGIWNRENNKTFFAVANVTSQIMTSLWWSITTYLPTYRVTPLSLTKKFRNHMVTKKWKVLHEFHWPRSFATRLTKMLQWLHLNNSHAYPFCKTTPGTISESHQQSCAIESRQQFFRCSNCDHIFVRETHSKWSRNYSVHESEGVPYLPT